jgi:CubicO group peptidase (beta-lactamase class C family)
VNRVLLTVIVALAACSSHGGRYGGLADAVARGEAPETKAVVVMRAGAIDHEAYFGGTDAETLHDARSVGKSFTALGVGIAIDRGVLPGVDVPVLPYLDHLRPFANDDRRKAEITVADLLTMSSAFACDDDDLATPGNEEHMYPQRSWARWVVDLPVKADYARDVSGRGPWSYCTAGVFLLGQVIERAAGEPVDQFLAEHLFAPLGIERWQFARSPTGEAQTGGQLRLRPRDLAALGWLVRQRGRLGDRQVVSAAFVDAALTVHRQAFPGQDYGYLFWRRTLSAAPCGDVDAWFMSGNGGNAVFVLDSLDAVVVVARAYYNHGRTMHDQTKALVERYILPDLCRARR